MATQTRIELIDDVDGSEASESLEFAIDGTHYEIDLNNTHAEELREAFARWVEAGRRVSTARKSPGVATRGANPGSLRPVRRTELPPQRAPIDSATRHAIQRFAKANGYKPPAERGRIATEVLTAWEDSGRPMD